MKKSKRKATNLNRLQLRDGEVYIADDLLVIQHGYDAVEISKAEIPRFIIYLVRALVRMK